MFTFGREHEKKCAAIHVRNPAQLPLIMGVVDAVHDLIEGRGSDAAVADAIRTAFLEGGAGVWEQAGSWLRKSSAERPALLHLWFELARHRKAEVRFRVACFLDDMPEAAFAQLSSAFAGDRSKAVAERAAAQASRRNRTRARG